MEPLDRSPRLLIPISRARSAPGLLDVAAAILRSEHGSGHLLGVVEQPLGRPIAENVTVARRYRALLRRITSLERRIQAGLGVQVRVASTLAQGVREADKNLSANARILGASDWQMTRAVVIPSALSWILASLHVSFGFALVGAIVGEFLGAREGMGLLIATAQGSFDSNGVFAAMIVIAVVALIAEWILTMIEDRLLTWRPETTIHE